MCFVKLLTKFDKSDIIIYVILSMRYLAQYDYSVRRISKKGKPMRELISKDQRIIMVPHDFKFANKGIITEVAPDYFMLELD